MLVVKLCGAVRIPISEKASIYLLQIRNLSLMLVSGLISFSQRYLWLVTSQCTPAEDDRTGEIDQIGSKICELHILSLYAKSMLVH